MYRQITLAALFSGAPITEAESALAYGDVLAAWKTYLKKYNDGPRRDPARSLSGDVRPP